MNALPIAHPIVLELLHDLLLQLRIRDFARTGNLKLIAHGNHVLDPMSLFIELFLGRVVVDGAFQINDSVLDRDLHILEFLELILQLRLDVVVRFARFAPRHTMPGAPRPENLDPEQQPAPKLNHEMPFFILSPISFALLKRLRE